MTSQDNQDQALGHAHEGAAAGKTPAADKKKDKKTKEEKTPATGVRSSGRERKTVAAVYQVEAPKEKEEIKTGQGSGTRLRDIKNVEYLLGKLKHDDDTLVGLHRVLYGKPGVKTTRRRDILEFNGFASEEEQEKARERLTKLAATDLSKLCHVFELGLGTKEEGTKEGKAKRIAEYLMKPEARSERDLAAAAQKKREKKRKQSEKKKSTSAGKKSEKKSDQDESGSDESESESEEEEEEKAEEQPAKKAKTFEYDGPLSTEEATAVKDIVGALDPEAVGMKAVMRQMVEKFGEGIKEKRGDIEKLALSLIE